MNSIKAIVCYLCLAPFFLFAEELIKEDFESGITAAVSKLESAEGTLKIVDKETNPTVAGADEDSTKALVFEEDGESYGGSFKPAMDFPIADPKKDGTFTVTFSFKQISGDASGLSVDLIQKTPGYGIWGRIYLGKDLTKLMVGSNKANGSLLPETVAFSNGVDAQWHTVVMKLSRKGDATLFAVKIDETVIARAPLFEMGNPTEVQALRFSDEGSGPDSYFIDNLSVTFEPLLP